MAGTEQGQTAPQVSEIEAKQATPSTGAKLKLLLLLVGLVIVECVVAYLFIPASPEAAASATPSHAAKESGPAQEDHKTKQQHHKAKTNGHSPKNEAPLPPIPIDAEHGDQVEVDLGQFSVTAFQPATNTTLRIDFHLWGTVISAEQGAFQAAWTRNNNRLRDQIISIVRASEMNDLTDAGLGLIKRRILEKTNASLGKPYLQAVIFSDFSFMEQ